jgi:pyruvate kinase
MSVARFDFSGGDNDYHQETLENLKIAVKGINKLCAIMLDTVGPELRVFNRSEEPIVLEIDAFACFGSSKVVTTACLYTGS